MKKCLIVSGGDFAPLPEDLQFDTVIACDKGYEYCRRMNLKPDLLIGDFDSYEGELPGDIPHLIFPVEKDDTDTMLAIRYALQEGAEEIILSSALGRRFDHTYANIQSLLFIALRGAKGILTGDGERMETFSGGEIRIPRRPGFSLSLFSLTETCRGVSVKGTKYQVENAALTSDFPIGTSNKWEADEAVIRMDEGVLLIIESREAGL